MAKIDALKDLVFHKSLCVLPWHGFTLFPNGNVKNCAISLERLGNVKQDSLYDILDNNISCNVRQDMQSNIKHERCNVCYRTEDLQNDNPLNKISNRIWYMKVLKNHDLSVYQQDSFVKPKVLDLRWRNTCNLGCIYCGPDLSSRWASERNKQAFIRIDEEFLDKTKKYIFENIKEIKHIYLAGGEPLLMKENLELLEELKKHNPTVTIRINTNLSNINNKIFDTLINDFKNTKWTVSIDAIEEDYEYIRYPGNWDIFSKNLSYLYSKTNNIDYNMTWSVLNAYSIFEATDFLQHNLNCPDSVFVIQPIFNPKALQINNLSVQTLEHIKTIIKERMQKCSSSLYKNSLESMLSSLDLPTNKRFNKTLKFLNIINKERSLTFPTSLTNLINKENKNG